MWARIENGLVVEITDIDPSGRFHSSITWTSCPPDVKAGMLYTGHSFLDANPDLPKLAMEARSERDCRMRNIYDIASIKLGREMRMASGDQIEELASKLAALDAYAVALLDIPQQAEFPTSIIWPETPTI